MTKFPDIGQMVKIPWHFFKIPWQFPDLEKILFFPDFSLTRGNPVWWCLNEIYALNDKKIEKSQWLNLPRSRNISPSIQGTIAAKTTQGSNSKIRFKRKYMTI